MLSPPHPHCGKEGLLGRGKNKRKRRKASVDVHIRVVFVVVHVILLRIGEARRNGGSGRDDTDDAARSTKMVRRSLYHRVHVLRPLRLVLTAGQLVHVMFQCFRNVRFGLETRKKELKREQTAKSTVVDSTDLGEILFIAVRLVQPQSHAHPFEDFDVVVDLERIVKGEEVLHLVAGNGAVDHCLLVGVHHQEGQLDGRVAGRPAVQPLVLLVPLNLQDDKKGFRMDKDTIDWLSASSTKLLKAICWRTNSWSCWVFCLIRSRRRCFSVSRAWNSCKELVGRPSHLISFFSFEMMFMAMRTLRASYTRRRMFFWSYYTKEDV